MNAKSLLPNLANAVLYLVTCGLVATGLLLELRLDGEGGARRILGLARDDWGEIHFVIALAFAALIVLHLALNWPLIRASIARFKPAVLVLLAGVVLRGAALLWPAQGGAATGEEETQRHGERR